MVTKEEQVLHPMAVDTLSDDEWAKIRAGEADIGYAFIEGVPEWPGGAAAGAAHVAAGASLAGAGEAGESAAGPLAAAGDDVLLALNTGGLSLEELNLVLGVLPIDFQYVDEHDRVRFYSEGHRIFPRSPGVIGRKVQNCHPPQSVHKVQQILDAFRAGEKDAAEFWIEMQGRFLHIRYFAVRDGGGAYRGVVETVQDVTRHPRPGGPAPAARLVAGAGGRASRRRRVRELRRSARIGRDVPARRHTRPAPRRAARPAGRHATAIRWLGIQSR